MMKLLAITLNLLLLCGTASASWTPIVGIPEPLWGTTNPTQIERPSLPLTWTANETGYYYVATGGTNAGNGYPGNPKGAMPSSPPAGSVVVISGVFTASPTLSTYAGTDVSPIWVIPADENTKIVGKWAVSGTTAYVIFDGLRAEFGHASSPASCKFEVGVGVDHVCWRNMYVTGKGSVDGTSGAGDVNQTLFPIYNPSDYGQTTDLIFYNNTMSLAGNWQWVRITDEDPDAHCISFGVYAENIWVIGNTMSYTSGDGVQAGAGTTQSTLDSVLSRNIYMGNNVIHHTAQSPLWSKRTENAVMSGNIAYTIRRDTASDPNAGCYGAQYGPKNLWILNNVCYDCQNGISIRSNSFAPTHPGIETTPVYIIGNVLHDIHDETSPTEGDWRTNAYREDGLAIYIGGADGAYIINNTIDDYDAGILNPANIQTHIYGNIFSAHNDAVDYADIHLDYDPSGANELNYNMFTGSPYVVSVASTWTSVASFTKGTGNVAGDPLFVSPSDYHLQSTSPAKDTGALSDVYANFQTLYGIDIKKDIAGVVRPQNTLWDIGAYEFIPPPSYYPFMSASGQVYKRP